MVRVRPGTLGRRWSINRLAIFRKVKFVLIVRYN